jgi:hypothetical protein
MIIKHAIGLGFAGALALGVASPTFAAPVSTNAAALKAAVASERVDVQWRGQRHAWRGGHWRDGRWWPGAAAGFAAGAAVGALGAAAATATGYPYGPYYDDPAYGAYAYSPGFDSGFGFECRTDEGYGRTSSCNN